MEKDLMYLKNHIKEWCKVYNVILGPNGIADWYNNNHVI